VYRRLSKNAHKAVSALVCALAIVAGCHSNSLTSGYGIAWVSFTDEPGDYAAYIITIDSVTLTRNDGAVVTAIATPEIIDFTQLDRYNEMWGSSAVPTGTYVSATITFDYTNAYIATQVNGLPQKATILDFATRKAPTTYAITVDFDPANQPTITPTYASTSAVRLAIDLDLAASGSVVTGSPPTVNVRPFVTATLLPADTKLTRVRGPLINSSLGVGTYTVYVRPFYDEANNIGTLTLFGQPNTVYTVNGITYVGAPGLNALSILSAGSTIAAAWTTFQPDYNAANGAHAGKFNMVYVVGASTLEDQYTNGLTGDVIARTGNTLTVLGSTLILNTANTYSYNVAPAVVRLGAGTIVTADDNSTLTGLSANSIAVGQHITARGIYSLAADGTTVILDATGTSSTNTGSVRLQSTEFWGSLVSSSAGGLVMNLQAINDWPPSDYNFTGNGATATVPAAFSVDTGTLAVPAGTVAGDPVWVAGFMSPFGSAPPDLGAVAVNNEASVQVAGGQVGGGASTAPGTGICGLGSQVCDPASLQVLWSLDGTATPFEVSSASGFSINLGNPAVYSAVIRIGPESIDMKSLPASPMVVPTALPVSSTFAPLYTVGNPETATTAAGGTAPTTALYQYSSYADFHTKLSATLGTANMAKQLEVRGIYNRTTNTFTATSINFVL
jgi:hypothetical protein